MPSGIVHDTVNLTFIIFASLLYFFLPYKYYMPFLIGFMFSTFLLSPDLDLSHSKISKRWGILKILFYPYFFLSTHRGLSHTIILGTIIRYFYILFILVIGYIIFFAYTKGNFSLSEVHLGQIKYYFLKYKNYILFFLLGSIAADTIHIILDRICSYEKKKYARMVNVKSNRKR